MCVFLSLSFSIVCSVHFTVSCMYRENMILLHDESTTKAKIQASEIVQHVFTHQWFGNLVTCAWWDYTWLNEGFGQYFQYFATKMVSVKCVLRFGLFLLVYSGKWYYANATRLWWVTGEWRLADGRMVSSRNASRCVGLRSGA